MFPWADGDNLREFWESVPQQHPNETLIVETLWQLRGIADAIYELHNFKGEDTKSQVTLDSPALAVPRVSDPKNEVSDYNDTTESIRHGDLKPDNLLRFLDRKSTLGTLKLADMGLAKRHVVATILREKPTSTRYGTIRYEAPEAVTNVGGGRSRLYDIWSMGCITFEFIIWNLYGNAALNAFHTQLNADSLQGCQYFKLQANSMPRQAEVHPVVRQWIYYLRNNDPECAGGQESAIADLLHIVHTQLLVVPLPPDRQSSLHGGRPLAMPALGESRASYRATASEFRDSLDNILKKVDKPGYLVSGKSRHNFRLPQPKAATHLSPDVALVDNIKGLKVEDLGTEAENGITGSRIRAPIPPSSLLQPQSVSASSPLRLTTSQRIRNVSTHQPLTA
jgi:serine/threonine protein kinase